MNRPKSVLLTRTLYLGELVGRSAKSMSLLRKFGNTPRNAQASRPHDPRVGLAGEDGDAAGVVGVGDAEDARFAST